MACQPPTNVANGGTTITAMACNAETLTLDSAELYSTAVSSISPLIPPKPPFSSPSIPASKLIPKTSFVVDFFRFPSSSDFSVTAFFLSHFHSDHYSGLSPSWSRGIIFCSHTTARLLIDVLQVSSRFVFSLPLQQTVVIDGCDVTLIDANHCPGAVQLLFKVRLENGSFERYIHTGDFRYCDSMKLDPFLCDFVGCDAVFLDTTYCNPKFLFPTQGESVDYVVSVIENISGEAYGLKGRVLFLVATYVVGKEKILVEIARRCKRKIYVDSRKISILRILGYGESGIFTEDDKESDVHVVGWNLMGETWPYFRPNFVRMNEIMIEKGYDKVVGFVPTGWTYEVKRNKFAVRSKDFMEIHLVPYSEHSNYGELREYVKFLKPKRVIPTVGIDIEKPDSKHVNKMQKHFSGLVDEMANKKEFLMGFHLSCQKNEQTETDVGLSLNEAGKEEDEKPFEASENSIPSFTSDVSSSSKEPMLQDSTITMDSSGIELLLTEIRDYLPAWVTREQMLGLISKAGANIVEIINNFYEREPELYEQVSLSTSTLETQAVVSYENVTLLQAGSVNSIPQLVQTSQKSLGSPSKTLLTKSTISLGKRNKRISGKSSKKVRSNPKMDPLGRRQSTITKFFNKVFDNVPDTAGIGSETEECPMIGNMVPSDAAKSYKEAVDRFIDIVNGTESLREYAASIIEKANGDVNRALDIYYGDPKEMPGETVSKGHVSSKSTPSLHINASGEQGYTVNLSLQKPLEENADTNHVSLPPEKYKPIEHACWRSGQPAPYIHLVRTFELVEGEKGKNRVMCMLCNMFRSLLVLSPQDVLPAVYLCTNKIAADHENIELNIGGSLITSALEEACGTSRSTIRDMYNSLGDFGDVAQLCRQTQRLLVTPPPLLVKDVLSTLQKISVQTGSGSTTGKKSLIVKLMRSCREKEIKFIVRTLVRNLRIGAMLRTVLPALAQAIVMNSFQNSHTEETSENYFRAKLQDLSTAVVEAYNVLPSLDVVVPSLMDKGIEFSSSTLAMVPGIPIKPMLAKISNGVQDLMKLFQDKAFTCEYKYDGQRAQVHKLSDGTVRIFSRNGDETTSRFPDLVDMIKKFSRPVSETFILDAEVVAVDRKNGNKLLSFQELSTRERGSKDSSVTLNRIKVDVSVFVFDIMFVNGEQLLSLPLRDRRKRLKELFPETRSGYFEYAKEITVEAEDASLNNQDTLNRITAFLEESFWSLCEGIMVKSLDVNAGYCPSKRSDSWLKLKRDYVDGLNDTLDLVPIGAWHGNGRKAGWYSPFLMACFNPETEEFQSVCRVMSGFSDSFYIEMKEFYSGDKILAKKPPYYRTAETPEKWFSPELVWQIRGADFTVSPVHHAAVGLVHPSRGISIRFPRFIRAATDRNPEECSTSADIAEMFRAQTRKMKVTSQH